MLYVAAPVTNASVPALGFVRLALPLTDVAEQLAAVRRIAFLAFGVGLLAALAIAWTTSMLVSRRVQAIAAVAERYARGDWSRPARDYGTDEIGTVARVLDDSAREIGRRATDLASDRARMEAILGGMIEGVLVVNDHGRVQLVNDAARAMLRLQDDPEGRHYVEIVRQPDIAAQLGSALHGTPTEGLELTLPREPELVIISRSAPVASPGAAGAVLVMHDITQLRRADRIRRDFVANVSHELRTPLTAVRGYVEALLDQGEEGTEPAQVRRFLEIIGRHTLRMERLVRDLLRLARLDAGQEPIERVPCPVASLFDGVETELASALEARQQVVEHHIARDAATVLGDATKLHDALRNLLENATNYAPESSRIVMGAERVGDRIRLLGRGRRPRHPRERPAARLRTLLPRRQIPHARHPRSRRHRPRAGHRQAPHRAARRQDDGGQPARGRGDFHDRPAVADRPRGGLMARSGLSSAGSRPRSSGTRQRISASEVCCSTA